MAMCAVISTGRNGCRIIYLFILYLLKYIYTLYIYVYILAKMLFLKYVPCHTFNTIHY